jgi:2-oxoglutarate dehydrogenase E2 component (dihydrolipoamide succinyltransferase)
MTSEVEIRAPAEQTEGTRSQILRWLKSVGDTVSENEPLIEIETDKVTVEVASPGSGTLREILRHEQEEITPGELLGRIEAHGAAAGRTATVDAARTVAAKEHGTADAAAVTPNAGGQGNGSARSGSISPAVRRLLAERGLDASQVQGTGIGGRITVEDVLGTPTGGANRSGGRRPVEPRSADEPRSAGEPPTAPVELDGATRASRRVPHTATRKRIAEHMVQSLLHTAPHVTTVFEADLGPVLEHRMAHKDEYARHGVALTLTAYFVQAAVDAICAVPEANSRWTDSALEIYDAVHIGVATALETGLVVPVLRDVQSRDLFSIAQGLDELVSRARGGGLTPADMRGGTFTISNHGVSGSLVATPIIINQPQSAILGVGKLEKRPVVVTTDGQDLIVVRPRCYVTLTIDHRVMDGHQANRFLQTFVGRLAAPGS